MKKLRVRVRCPYCGGERETESLKRVNCFHCGKSFSICIPGKNKTRIVRQTDGTPYELMKEFYKQKIYRKKSTF